MYMIHNNKLSLLFVCLCTMNAFCMDQDNSPSLHQVARIGAEQFFKEHGNTPSSDIAYELNKNFSNKFKPDLLIKAIDDEIQNRPEDLKKMYAQNQ